MFNTLKQNTMASWTASSQSSITLSGPDILKTEGCCFKKAMIRSSSSSISQTSAEASHRYCLTFPIVSTSSRSRRFRRKSTASFSDVSKLETSFLETDEPGPTSANKSLLGSIKDVDGHLLASLNCWTLLAFVSEAKP